MENIHTKIGPDHVDLCSEIATIAHAQQVRRGGDPYITHPARIVKRITDIYGRGGVNTYQYRVMLSAAWLHDVLEDTDLTSQDLLDKGVCRQVVHLVEVLTYEKESPSYVYYIQCISVGKIASIIKTLDIIDNISDNPTDKQVEKYTHALLILNGGI